MSENTEIAVGAACAVGLLTFLSLSQLTPAKAPDTAAELVNSTVLGALTGGFSSVVQDVGQLSGITQANIDELALGAGLLGAASTFFLLRLLLE